MTKRKEVIDRAHADANSAKDRLISIMDYLEEHGAMKQAEDLGKIILRLEIWQNKC